MASRHEARERALHLLYEAETKALDPAAVLARLPLPPDAFTVELVEGVSAHQGELDRAIAERARGWRLERMPSIDRAVLRLAAFELSHHPDTPTGVIIDEAVQLAKQYSTEDSGRFVNGVLSALASEGPTSC